MLISTQRHINQDIVDNNIASSDFEVLVSPEFELDGQTCQLILDGHHAYHAAITSGNSPEFVVADSSDNDSICLLNDGDTDSFLDANYIDSPIYNIETGEDLF